MKLKFIDQQYQTDAVNAICDIFEGTEVKDSVFTIKEYNNNGNISIGNGNNLTIDDDRLLDNIQEIQSNNNIQMSKNLKGMNFTIEMETGTGKTYVYIKTILELNKRFGFNKFIIVVPSIAIKEGVNNAFIATNEHFLRKYNVDLKDRWFVYNSNKLARIRRFAEARSIEIMIINIDAFRKSFKDPTNDKSSANIIHRVSEKLSGNKPIDLIASTNPIVIIDEPQSVDNTEKSKEAIASLNPLCILRYSATHRVLYNLMYRLTPVDAYQENLVKHIEVASITSDNSSTKAYVKLLSVSKKDNKYKCRIEIYVKNKKSGSVEKKVVTAKTGQDLWELSNEVEYYKDSKYIIDNIDCFPGEEAIIFQDGTFINIGESIGELDPSIIKRAQIRQTIISHLDKELHYIKKGIKVLSLFFIDEVKNYRDYEASDEKGIYAKWFEEEYTKLINLPRYKELIDKYGDFIYTDASYVHTGYFSKDGKNHYINSNGNGISSADASTYETIMKDKEELLSFHGASYVKSIRFIFSHSALKEGWDNPNIFQVCTLVETKDTLTKRQKIGRGLRLCVNQDGDRVLDMKYNILTVIANESYKDFADSLQKELETDNFKFGIVEPISFAGISVKQANGERYELSQTESEEIFNYLVENEYMTKNGKVTQKYYQDVHDETFILPDKYESFTDKVIKNINSLSKEIEIKDASKKVSVKLNKEVQLSDEFKILWNKIKQKTKYSINMDLEKFMYDAIDKIKNMPIIKPMQIKREKVNIDITNSGIKEDSVQTKMVNIDKDDEIKDYPDFVRRLQDSTSLLRRTIINIVVKSGRLKDFYINPEECIKQVSMILDSVKKEYLTKGIKYEKIDEYYEQDIIFNDEGLTGYKDRNILEVSSRKNIFDHVIYESQNEKRFAQDAENDDDVILYAKLPSKFIIDTPLGNYNPDWAVVLNKDNEEKLYFVTETKGNENAYALRGIENGKIFCGRKHFEVLDSGIKYEIVKEFKKLKELS